MSFSSSLNAATSRGSQNSISQPGSVSFRAGRCKLQSQSNGKFLVTSDLRRGQMTVSSDNSGRTFFRWTANGASLAEEERIVPHAGSDCSFKKVNTGRESDRVYLLCMPNGNGNGNNGPNRLMFWMQNVDDSKDSDNVKRVNELFHSARLSALSSGAVDFSNLFSQTAPITTPAVRATQPSLLTPNTGAVTLEDLRRAMQGSSTPGAASSAGTATSAGGHVDVPAAVQPTRRLPDLQDILTGEEILRSGVLSDPQVQSELLQHLPAEQKIPEELQTTIRSAQFQQSLGSLSHALRQQDNFQQIADGFQLNSVAGRETLLRTGDPVRSFLDAVEQAAEHVDESNDAKSHAENEEKKMEE